MADKFFEQKWHDKRFERQTVNPEINRRLEMCAIIWVDEAKEVITDKELVDTGMYRATTTYELYPEDLRAKGGSPITNPPYLPYPLYLEFGTYDKGNPKGIPAHKPYQTALKRSEPKIQAVWR